MQVRSLLVSAILAMVGTAANAARSDEQADALLKEVIAATQAAETLTADVTMTQKNAEQEVKLQGKLRLKKPNFARIELTGALGHTIVSDGKTVWDINLMRKQYTQTPADPQGRNIGALWATPVRFFFNPAAVIPPARAKAKIMVLGKDTVDGQEFTVVSVATEFEQSAQQTELYIGADKLIHRMNQAVKRNDSVTMQETVLSNVKVGAALSDADFAFQPPSGLRAVTTRQPTPAQRTSQTRLYVFSGAAYTYEPAIDAALMLTTEQKNKIQATVRETVSSPALNELRRKAIDQTLSEVARKAATEQLRAELPKAQDEFKKRVEPLLTDEQKATVQKVDAALRQTLKEIRAEFDEKIKNASEVDRQRLREEITAKTKAVFAAKLDSVLSAEQKDALARAKGQ